MPALWFANQGWPSQDNLQPYVFVFDGGRSTSVIPKLPILSCLGDFSIDTVPEQHAEVGVISNASSPDLSLTDTAPPPTLLKRRARSNSSASWMKCLPSTSIAPVRLSQLVGQQLHEKPTHHRPRLVGAPLSRMCEVDVGERYPIWRLVYIAVNRRNELLE